MPPTPADIPRRPPTPRIDHPESARLAVLASGGGRTLRNLLDHQHAHDASFRIALVITSRDCGATAIGNNAGVPTHVLPMLDDAETLASLLREHAIDLAALAGYLRKVPVPADYAGRILNIHPALLPEFGGRGMFGLNVHRAVIEAGATESGCTVHLVEADYDTGPILAQRRCPVRPGDTPETLAARVFELEKQVYPRVIAERLRELAP